MATFADWVAELVSTQNGRIWLSNYTFDVNVSNLAASLISDFEDAIAKEWDARRVDPFALIDEVLRKRTADFDLRCVRIPAGHEPYSRVMSLATFWSYNLRLSALGIEIDERTGDRVWDMLGTRITNRHFTGTMQTERSLFWIAPQRTVARLQASAAPGNEANEIRNQLGLAKVIDGQRLVRIDLPDALIAGKRIAAPTTLDAGSNTVFVPSNDPRGIGWTLNLQTLGRGVEELVIEVLDFTPDYQVSKIGMITEPVPSLNLDSLEAGLSWRSV